MGNFILFFSQCESYKAKYSYIFCLLRCLNLKKNIILTLIRYQEYFWIRIRVKMERERGKREKLTQELSPSVETSTDVPPSPIPCGSSSLTMFYTDYPRAYLEDFFLDEYTHPRSIRLWRENLDSASLRGVTRATKEIILRNSSV